MFCTTHRHVQAERADVNRIPPISNPFTSLALMWLEKLKAIK